MHCSTVLRCLKVSRSKADTPNLRAFSDELGGPVGDDLLRRVGGDLARAVGLAHAAGLVHDTLTPRTVLVTDHGVRLIGWMTATVDGAHSDYRDHFPRSET